MQYFPSLPKSEQLKWRNLKTVMHFQCMKGIHTQDVPHLRKVITEWDCEVFIPEQKIYSLYFRAFLYMIWRHETAWKWFIEKAQEVFLESGLERFKPEKLRAVFATGMWASAVRGDTARTDEFASLAKEYGEPAETINVSKLLAIREIDQALELLDSAIESVKQFDFSDFYVQFLKSTFSEEHLAMLDIDPEEVQA